MESDNRTIKYAPELDNALVAIEHTGSISGREISSRRERQLLEQIGKVLELLDNHEGDTRIDLWFTAERGSITDWETYEEAAEYEGVTSQEDYQKTWLEYYPEEVKFYRFTYFRHEKFIAVFLGEDGCIESREEIIEEKYNGWNDLTPLLEWTLEQSKKAMQQIISGEYDSYIKEKLPFYYRTGTISRRELWQIIPSRRAFDLAGWEDDSLTDEEICTFQHMVEEHKNFHDEDFIIENMTAAQFFAYCRIGYEGNHIPHCQQFADDVELYKRLADGRDDGLTKIDLNSAEEFSRWMSGELKEFNGGHPWEVLRGGNSTHVNLYVGPYDEVGTGKYYLYLAGLHRPGEVIRFYIALRQHNIMVDLADKDELLARCLATDKVGIVPNGTFPRYCENLFPGEKVIDFKNIYASEDYYTAVVEKTSWQELKLPKLSSDFLTVKELLQFVDMATLVEKEIAENEEISDKEEVYTLWQTFLRKMSDYPCQESKNVLIFTNTWDGFGDEVEEYVDVSLYEWSALRKYAESSLQKTLQPQDSLKKMSAGELKEYYKRLYDNVPTGFAFEFSPWQEILGYKVNIGNLRRQGLQDCIYAVLTEMTFNGMTEESQGERRQELDTSIKAFEEIEKLSLEEQKKHFRSFDDFCKEKGWQDERSPEEKVAKDKRIWLCNAITGNEKIHEIQQICSLINDK